ncbi:TPA: fimbrial protein [Aeromonas veronii]
MLLKCILWSFICLLSIASNSVLAACQRSEFANTSDNETAKIKVGKINITSTYLQPIGSLLASTVIPPTNYTFRGANASTVIWTCDLADLPSLYYLVAVNGDDRVGGFWATGAADGLPYTYATWFEYVGLKLTMSGVPLERVWRKVPLTNYVTDNGKIRIRLGDIPPLHAELYRISNLPPASGAASNYCGNMGAANGTGLVYGCNQPNAYIQLVGPGIAHDAEGSDSAYSYHFWGANNGFGYGLLNAATLSNNATCVARNATPLVLFRTMTVEELNAGGVANSSFSVSVECSDKAISGTGSGHTTIGMQVSPGAYTAAQRLGLVNPLGGVSALLSDDYDASSSAKGVGIYLSNAVTSKSMNFVGQPGLAGQQGASSGWFPVLEGATMIGSSASGYANHRLRFDVELGKIPGETVKPGKIRSTAYVLVKVQ